MEIRRSSAIRFLIVFAFASVFARPAFSYGPLHGARFISASGAAMGNGNAYLGAGDDLAYSLFYDPSYLAQSKDIKFEAINLNLSGSLNFLSMFGGNFISAGDLPAQKAALAENPLALTTSSRSLLSGFVLKNIAFGILIKNEFAAEDYGNGLLYYQGTYQVIPAFAAGLRFFKGQLRLGLSVQWVNQATARNETSSDIPGTSYVDRLYQGSGISNMLAISFKANKFKRIPELHLVVRNVLGVNYTETSLVNVAKNSRGAPESEPMLFDFGLSGTFKFGRQAGLGYVLQFNDVTGRTEVPVEGRIGFALEWSTKRGSPGSSRGRTAFYARLGWGLGYPSAGLGYNMGRSTYSITWSSDDPGMVYHELQDERILFQYQLQFGKTTERVTSGGASK